MKIWIKNFNKKFDYFFSEISKIEPALVDEGDFNGSRCFIDIETYMQHRKSLLHICMVADDLIKMLKATNKSLPVEVDFLSEAIEKSYKVME